MYVCMYVCVYLSQQPSMLQLRTPGNDRRAEIDDFGGNDEMNTLESGRNRTSRPVSAPNSSSSSNNHGHRTRKQPLGQALAYDSDRGGDQGKDYQYDSSSSSVSGAIDRGDIDRVSLQGHSLDVNRRSSKHTSNSSSNSNFGAAANSSRATLSQIKARQALARQPTRIHAGNHSSISRKAAVINYAQHADRFSSQEQPLED